MESKKEAILLKYPVVKKYETMLKLYNTGKNDSLKLQLNQQLQNMRDSIENYNRALKLATIQWIEIMPHSYISATELYSLMINQQLGTIEANRLFHHLTDPVQQSRVGQLIAATLQKSMVNIKALDFKAKDFNQENFQHVAEYASRTVSRIRFYRNILPKPVQQGTQFLI